MTRFFERLRSNCFRLMQQANRSGQPQSAPARVPRRRDLVRNTGDLLFSDLWMGPDPATRERILVTVSTPISTGQVQRIMSHLNQSMDNRVTREQACEVISSLAYYADWPNASAGP
jgi:alkylhydroperoxidase/carboxymuconolactone decarboxylase family protein YurZ